MSGYCFVHRPLVAVGMLFLWAVSTEGQSVFYVRAGAAGARNGSDWNNAYTALPPTLAREATYYVAGGSYPSYTFNTALSGTSVVTVKKASLSDHGTNTGWNASYGASQAVFASNLSITRGYFVLDGQYRNEADWFDGGAYGFQIANNGAWQNLEIRDPNGIVPVPNVTIKYLYIAAIVGRLPSPGSARPYPIDTEAFNPNIANGNYLFSHVYVEGGNNPFFIRSLRSPVVEYCASWKTCGDADFHGEVVNLFYSSAGGGTIRYNRFKDCYNGAAGYHKGGGTGVIAISETSGAQIYGNIFENYYVGDGAIAAGWANSNIKVYNNTFVNGELNSPTVLFPQLSSGHTGTGNEAYNNLAVGCAVVSYSGAGTFGSNSTESASVFVNYEAGDYRLARHTAPGLPLPAPFNIDLAGKVRGMATLWERGASGTDSVWDRGAYQYSNPHTNPILSISPPTLVFGVTPRNTSQELSLTVQNSGGATLVGMAQALAPFSIISGQSYSLGANQSQTVTVRFNPLAPGSHSQVITFTGGGGAAMTVSGTAVQ